jgi:hypothetical protein
MPYLSMGKVKSKLGSYHQMAGNELLNNTKCLSYYS